MDQYCYYAIIILLSIMIICLGLNLYNKQNITFSENFTTDEAIANIAKLYNENKLTIGELVATKGVTINDGAFLNILPKGIIVAWSNETVPSGWILCDGQNGTPDLRSKFILGAGPNDKLGSSGGERTHKLSVSEMPSHTHGIKRVPNQSYNRDLSEYTCAGCHKNHSSLDVGGASLGWGTDSTGGDQPHNNMPPYYALTYIMKI